MRERERERERERGSEAERDRVRSRGKGRGRLTCPFNTSSVPMAPTLKPPPAKLANTSSCVPRLSVSVSGSGSGSGVFLNLLVIASVSTAACTAPRPSLASSAASNTLSDPVSVSARNDAGETDWAVLGGIARPSAPERRRARARGDKTNACSGCIGIPYHSQRAPFRRSLRSLSGRGLY